MDIAAKAYRLVGTALIGIGLLLGFASGLPWIVGFGALVFGFALLATPLILNGLPALLRRIWSSSEPSWDGEILHTDGGDAKVRYGFDPDGTVWFVAKDICRAIGVKAPGSRSTSFAGVRLVMRKKLGCFPEKSVTSYLALLAVENRDARRLLVLLQTQVLRKIADARERQH